jgi:hypothetical protein
MAVKSTRLTTSPEGMIRAAAVHRGHSVCGVQEGGGSFPFARLADREQLDRPGKG